MIPEHRLAVLLDNVQDGQVDDCLYHNTLQRPSLYYDHTCTRDDFPTETLLTLSDHTDEVWCIAFSPSGSMFASGSSDNRIFVYETTAWRLKHQLFETPGGRDTSGGIAHLSWSPDERFLVSCSPGRQVTIYDIRNGGQRFNTIDNFAYAVGASAWLPDSQSLVICSQDPDRALGQYRVGESSPFRSFIDTPGPQIRCYDCSLSGDGARLVASTTDHKILIFDLTAETSTLRAKVTMDDLISSVSLNRHGTQILTSLKNRQIYLLNATDGQLLQKYTGPALEQYVIRSKFGGADEGFVVSGSEGEFGPTRAIRPRLTGWTDSRVYIWRKHSGVQVACIEAHKPGAANCIAWHPTNPAVLATAGDDNKIKV